MSSTFKVQKLKFGNIFLYCLLLTVCCSLNCGIRNIEKPECAETRDAVKKFYSFHFGNDMKPTKENLQMREKYLTDELKQKLAAGNDSKTDYFTATDDYPKAFRVGGCAAENENETITEVLLFWKDDKRSEQREIKVESVKQNNNWLINQVGN